MKGMKLEDNPLWYKDAVIYEVHVRAFADSNGDGIGDFRGLTQKLDYLERLGVNTIWLLPFYPSPLKDDGYDIADYFSVHKDYGTLKDFHEFLKAAHSSGLRVITELVLNHTSGEHPWFQKSRQARPGSSMRNFYVWSTTPDRYKDARIIFKDFEASNWTWDPVAQAYYWHRFYSHQPDLNYDNPAVQKAMLKVIDFWLSIGVDGMRIDAVPYLFERENTNCENLPETHAFLKKLRAHVDSRFKNRMLLAEANQWPEDAVAYFGDGDESHMAFHFPLMPRMFMSIQMEDSFPILDILRITPSIPETCQWSTFLRNHDELTLEMVTDEERDYMYRMYARDPRAKINIGIRRRLAPLLMNNRKRIELMNILLFSLPGTPVIYYGDEIGMGDNYYLGDRNGVRTPMQWTGDRNAGFSRANPHSLYLPVIIDPEYHYEAVNVENQERNLSSFLWWMKRVIAMRKRFRSMGRGSLEFVSSNNSKTLSFIRRDGDEIMLIVVNLSRFTQVVQLDLSGFSGYVPEEVFSRNRFPVIRKRPYVLMLGPHNHYWLLLEKQKETAGAAGEAFIPQFSPGGTWDDFFAVKRKKFFEENILPGFLRKSRWFGSKSRSVRAMEIMDVAAVVTDGGLSYILMLEIFYRDGTPERYMLPVSFCPADRSGKIVEESPRGVIAHVKLDDGEGIIYDAVLDADFRNEMLQAISRRKKIKCDSGVLLAISGPHLKKTLASLTGPLASHPVKSEQSNTSVVFGRDMIFKLYRRLDEGVNPELEITRALAENNGFSRIPDFLGAVEYSRRGEEQRTVAMLQQFVENVSDAWTYALDSATRYYESVIPRKDEYEKIFLECPSIFETDNGNMPAQMTDLIGGMFLDMMSLLGKRTGELHISMAALPGEQFRAEPFSALYQRSLYQSMQSLAYRTMDILEKSIGGLAPEIRKDAKRILKSKHEIMKMLQRVLNKKIAAVKIRIHGDYHLGQVLFTGKDFVIIDFEGEPARTVSERKLKRSPLKDVAGIIRSFHYAAYGTLILRMSVNKDNIRSLEHWAELWYAYTSGVFLRSYLSTVEKTGLLPKNKEDIEVLLQTFLLEKAVYEVAYELNNRPAWVEIPLKGIEHILDSVR
ncbi:MAG: maltose alpha-D-glucosyltransferase [Candidatus Omnitrophota bacterium]